MIALVLVGCIGTTGGERVSFHAVAEPLAPADGGVIAWDDAVTGWHVELTEAEVSVGPAYLWSGEPLLTSSGHVIDHFVYGHLRGELLEQAAVDLLGTETPIADGEGLAGEANSGELWLAPPLHAVADELDGQTFLLAGSATRDATVVPFAGSLTIDDEVIDVEGGQTAFEQRKVRGIPLHTDVEQGGTLVVGIDGSRMLSGAHFDDLLEQTPEDGVYPLIPGTSVWAVLYYQVRQAGATGPWTLTWRP
jgi:hypothetical protein